MISLLTTKPYIANFKGELCLNKYRNIKTQVDGIKFDSKKEANRYCELKLLLKTGDITDLNLQVPFVLFDNSLYGRKVKYLADFTYIDVKTGKVVVEDVKGILTPVYKLKKRILAEKFDIEINEV